VTQTLNIGAWPDGTWPTRLAVGTRADTELEQKAHEVLNQISPPADA